MFLSTSYSEDTAPVQWHCGDTSTTHFLTSMDLARSVYAVRVALIVYWYNTCDRCFTLMM